MKTYDYQPFNAFERLKRSGSAKSELLLLLMFPLLFLTGLNSNAQVTVFENTDPGWAYSAVEVEALSNTNHSGGSAHMIWGNDGTATYTFTGTSVSVYGSTQDWTGPSGEISIDGGPTEVVNWTSAADLFQQLIWSSPPLSSGQHTLVISPAGDVPVLIDYIEVTAGAVSPLFTLTVNSGSGDGSYAAGTVVNLSADAPPTGQEFDVWTGDVSTVADINSPSTTITMPAANATVTATYSVLSADFLTVNPSSLSFGPAAGPQSVTVSSNVGWTVAADQGWIAVNPGSGSNNGSFNVALTENTGTGARNGTITVSGTGVTDRLIAVSQSGQVSGGPLQHIGVNVGTAGGQVDYQAEKPWADMMRTHRSWDVAVDANGWPVADGSVIVAHGLNTGNNYGTYKLRFDCNNPSGVSVTENWGGGIVQNKSVSGNRVTYDLVFSDVNVSEVNLTFSNTSGGVRNVTLMRPVTPGSTESYAEGTLFTSEFIAALQPFGTIRYMHWMAGDSPLEHINWSDRTPWDYATLQPPSLYDNWGARGPAWETVTLVANAVQADVWIPVPVRATDAYITRLAEFFRDGNDVVPPLDPNLKLYIEWGNEIWNGGTYPTQWNYAKAAGAASAVCAYDGETDENTLAFRYHAQRMVEISDIFRSVFGDSQMHTRIRPYIGHQHDYYDIVNRTLVFLDKYYAGKDPASDYNDPHPFNYYIYAYGGSTYYYVEDGFAPPALTLDNIWESGTYNSDNHFDLLTQDAYFASGYGVSYIPYEGGQHPLYNGDEVITRQAATDPRMYQKTIDQHRVFNRVGGEFSCYYRLAQTTGVGDITAGHFGMLTGDIGNLDQPRYNAIVDLINETPENVTLGNVPPFTVDGRQYNMISAEELAGMNAGPGAQVLVAGENYATSYGFHVNANGTYHTQVSYSSATNATLQIEADGAVLESFNLTGSGTTSLVNFSAVTNTLHAVRLVCVSGSVTINSLTVAPAAASRTTTIVSEDTGNPIDDTFVKQQGVENLIIYPNPSSGSLKLALPGSLRKETNPFELEIRNLTGAVLYSKKHNAGEDTIDIKHLSKGVYILSLKGNDQHFKSRFVVE